MNRFGKMLKFYQDLHENMKKDPVFIANCSEKQAVLHKDYFHAIGVKVTATPSYDSSRFPKPVYSINGEVIGYKKYKPKLLGYEFSITENEYSL